MAHKPDELQWIDLRDFTQGIFSEDATSGGTVPSTAQPGEPYAPRLTDVTAGALGHPHGGIAPMPWCNRHITDTISDIGAPGTKRPAGTTQVVLSTALVSGIVARGDGSKTFTSPVLDFESPDELFVHRMGWWDAAGTSNFQAWHYYDSYRMWKDPFDKVLRGYNYTMPVHRNQHLRYGLGDLCVTRSKPKTADVVGAIGVYPVIAGVYGGDHFFTYPDLTDPNTDMANTVGDFSNSLANSSVYRLVHHQGRLAYVYTNTNIPWNWGANVSSGVADARAEIEGWGYTTPEDYWSTARFANGIRFDSVYPSGVGVVHSVNDNELFIVRQQAGGSIIRGALDYPTITHMPGIEPTRGRPTRGVATPKGFVYGSRSGVWVWNGGDASEHISPQLDGWFWKATGADQPLDTTDTWATYARNQAMGKFNYSHPFILAPGGWVCDVRSGGWFRLGRYSEDEPGANFFGHYEVGGTGMIYGIAPHLNIGGANNPLITSYDPSSTRPDWEFQTHPIPLAGRRRVTIRRIEFDVEAFGETWLGGYIDSTAFPAVTISGAGRQIVAIDCAIDTINPQLWVITAATANKYGLRLHSVRLGYAEDTIHAGS